MKFKLIKFSKEHLDFLRKSGSANFIDYNKNKRLKVLIHDFNTDKTTLYGSIDESSKAIKVDAKVFWTQEKSEQKNNDVIPYQGRYLITNLREGVSNLPSDPQGRRSPSPFGGREDHVKRIELARVNISNPYEVWGSL